MRQTQTPPVGLRTLVALVGVEGRQGWEVSANANASDPDSACWIAYDGCVVGRR
jgi:hypothetical protein